MNESSQAFTHFVVNRIDPQIRRTLTSEQLEGIKDAIAANAPLKRHSLDLRGILPLFFARFYFVVLMGRDRRHKVKRKELFRRKESDTLVNVIFYFFIVSPLLLLTIMALYLTKTELGIDLFPDSHLVDWFD